MNTRDSLTSFSSQHPKAHIVVSFWGVRGVRPCWGPSYVIHGGHTVCTEVFIESPTIPPTSLIFDAGSGLADLGDHLFAKSTPHRVLLFLSHVHLDHMMGIPFLKPLWHSPWLVDFYCGNLRPFGGLQAYLESILAPPLFPVPFSAFPGRKSFHDIDNGQLLDFGGFQVRPFALNHPDKAFGFRLTVGDRIIAYVTDTEHIPGETDQSVLRGIHQADCVIYDSTYADETLGSHQGWGHSTWQEGIRLCKKAGAQKLILYHHAPENDDVILHRIEKEAQQLFKETFVARQGHTFTL